jgi:hypothetical protein
MTYTEEQYLKNTLDSYQAGRQIGRDEEKKRILELLESRVDVVQELAYAIELIQGEN